jgi:ankyrin repeat protein
MEGFDEAVALLLGHGVDPNKPDDQGITPLSWASRSGHTAVVTQLLAAGSAAAPGDMSVDWTDAMGRTALFWAAKRGHETTVQALLGAGANPTKVDANGRTAISVAVEGNLVGMVRALLRDRESLHDDTTEKWIEALDLSALLGNCEIECLLCEKFGGVETDTMSIATLFSSARVT